MTGHFDRSSSAPEEGGFTLVEALVALAIVGALVLLEVGAQWQSRSALDGLAVESALLASAQATVESVRAGAVPLLSGRVNPILAWPVSGADRDEVLSLEIRSAGIAGLCRVTVRASSSDRRGRLHTVELRTQVWRHGATCQ